MKTDVVDEINFRNAEVMVFDGQVYIDQAGEWWFGTISDDGSLLYIDNELLVDNDGLHSDQERKASI